MSNTRTTPSGAQALDSCNFRDIVDALLPLGPASNLYLWLIVRQQDCLDYGDPEATFTRGMFARKAGCTARTVTSYIKTLTDAGLLEVGECQREEGGGMTPFRLFLPAKGRS